ncbi:MAG: hypothetical protein WD045_15190 [Pirellulaceae bacterium]
MFSRHEINTLREVVAMHYRSMPNYLMYAHPWFKPGKSQQLEILRSVANDQSHMVEKVVHLVEDQGEPVAMGEFPMEFTGYHDLSFSYLLKILLGYQERFVARLEQLGESLESGGMAKNLVEEAIGMAIGHLENLREVADNKGVPTA